MALQEQDLDGLEGIIANNDRVCRRVELRVILLLETDVLGRNAEFDCSNVAKQVVASDDEEVEEEEEEVEEKDITMYRLEW